MLTKARTTPKDEFTEVFFSTMTTGLQDVLKSVKESHSYFSMGLEDELAQAIGKFIEDPLSVLAEHYNKQVAAITNLLAHGVENFIATRKNLIASAYKTNDNGNELYYSIVLKKDELKNRESFYDFLNEYDSKPIAKYFPINFEFVPQNREKQIRQIRKINV